jgi:AbrB family looped-hinge helix DNA binding protein
MPSATVTSKGQITIPQQVRVALGVSFGDRIDFVEMEKGQFMIVPATHSIKELKGFIQKRGKPVPIEEMDGAAALRKLNAPKR